MASAHKCEFSLAALPIPTVGKNDNLHRTELFHQELDAIGAGGIEAGPDSALSRASPGPASTPQIAIVAQRTISVF